MSTRDHPDWWRPTGGQNSQDSILERRSLIWNDSDIEAPNVPPNAISNPIYIGKFFPRGCRGMLNRVEVYCRDTGVNEKLYIAVTPHPGLGPVKWDILIPGIAWGWYGIDIDEMWDYDSMFIYIYSSVNTDVGYDEVLPYDSHRSVNLGINWFEQDRRYYIRAIVTGETPGDVPVSGIVNTIRLPNWTPDQIGFTTKTVPGPGERSIGTTGIGTLINALWHVRSDAARNVIAPYIDLDESRIQPSDVSMQDLHDYIDDGSDRETWTWPRWDETNNYYTLQLSLPLPFQRSIWIGAENTGGVNQDVQLYGIYTRLR